MNEIYKSIIIRIKTYNAIGVFSIFNVIKYKFWVRLKKYTCKDLVSDYKCASVFFFYTSWG